MPRLVIYILWSALPALLTACGPGRGEVRVQGEIGHVRHAELYLYCADGTAEGIDTLRVEKGKFKGDISVSEPCLYTLLLQNFTEYSIILEPGATVSISGDAQNLAGMDVAGTEENELLTEFRMRTLGKSEADVRRAAADFIRSHSGSLAAVAVLRDVFARQQYPDPATVSSLLSVLKKAQPKSRALRHVEQALRPKLVCPPGKPLPDFSAPTIAGGTVSTSDFAGKPLVIALVATWAQNFNEQLRLLHEARRNGPEGLQIMLVSLDTDTIRLRQRLATDSLRAPVVCDGKSFASPTAQAIGAQYVSTSILVGSDGRVKARDIEPKRLPEEVKKLK